MAKRSSSVARQLAIEMQQTPDEYLPLLLEIVHAFRESVTLKAAPESFKQGWKEARSGCTRPVKELWDGID